MKNFLIENWAIIALVASEAMALLPTKAKGIVQTVIRIGGIIFKKKEK